LQIGLLGDFFLPRVFLLILTVAKQGRDNP